MVDKKIINYLSFREAAPMPTAIILLFFLTILDGHFTCLHLVHGATEANPLLLHVLNSWGIDGLLWAKFSVTLPCLFILQSCFRLPLAQRGVHFLLVIYGGLSFYHIWGFALNTSL